MHQMAKMHWQLARCCTCRRSRQPRTRVDRRWRRFEVAACGLTFELRGRSRDGAWPAKRSIDQQRFAGQAACRWRSRSSDQLGTAPGTKDQKRWAWHGEPGWRGSSIHAKREPQALTTAKFGEGSVQSPKRQNELNQRFRSGSAASATRSRVFAAHGRERRRRVAVLPAAA